ncbi:hypothetical protein H7F15_17245 [Pontibacter sp. Tf4]|uniref:hypothetical protein n=1 Tax=Pontibacter sp. Tf4 TaxID=2761620 RepID=UPI001625BA63|nr:hypothetical protein [Pontibacter sp. Tf4]MBB6612791.1 hypothetical protein [Pontibacter sp. Tf4]
MKKITLSLGLLLGISISSFAQITLSDLPYARPYDKRGLNIFETSKKDTIPFEGIKVRLGGGFAQQFQGLQHKNSATAIMQQQNGSEVNLNQLMPIENGFNLASANLNLDVALADGIRLNLVTYLSSRHHSEAWVKGGYIQVDKAEFLNSPLVDKLMENLTVKVGHMEINYGDAHFRRTDNAHALQNPFVGNYIMDAFTTEIGAELIYQYKGFLAVGSVTGGEIQGGIQSPGQRKPSYIGKLGYDSQVNDDLRLRLTGSVYTTSGSVRNTLYGGDRAGSRYFLVMDPAKVASGTAVTPATHFTSGNINPGLTNSITAMVINPFVKFRGLELFGNFEQAKGKGRLGANDEPTDRTWKQLGTDVVYRFGNNENLYVAGRYNVVEGRLAPLAASPNVPNNDVTLSRVQVGGGWFVTKNIVTKAEYVKQQYKGFAPSDIRHGGEFDGFMIEGAISF